MAKPTRSALAARAKAGLPPPPPKGKKAAVPVPTPVAEEEEEDDVSSEGSTIDFVEDGTTDEEVEGEDVEEDEDEDEDEDEEDDVTPEAMQRMMELLGDVDPEELGLDMDGEDEEGSEVEDEEEEEEDEDEEMDADAILAALDSDSDDQEEDEELGSEDDLEAADAIAEVKTTVNNKEALLRVLATFQTRPSAPGTEDHFFETLTLTHDRELEIEDPSDDLKRELEFYKQALSAAMRAETLFSAHSLPFSRPSDYFAEMLKTDSHMARIRQKLLDEQAGIKASEEARSLRERKKFGKKVEVEKRVEREKSKRELNERVEGLKKKRKNGDAFGTAEDFDIALEDAISGAASNKRAKKVPESERGRGRGGKQITRRGRDSKFGFGGGKVNGVRRKENNDRIDGDGFGVQSLKANLSEQLHIRKKTTSSQKINVMVPEEISSLKLNDSLRTKVRGVPDDDLVPVKREVEQIVAELHNDADSRITAHQSPWMPTQRPAPPFDANQASSIEHRCLYKPSSVPTPDSEMVAVKSETEIDSALVKVEGDIKGGIGAEAFRVKDELEEAEVQYRQWRETEVGGSDSSVEPEREVDMKPDISAETISAPRQNLPSEGAKEEKQKQERTERETARASMKREGGGASVMGSREVGIAEEVVVDPDTDDSRYHPDDERRSLSNDLRSSSDRPTSFSTPLAPNPMVEQGIQTFPTPPPNLFRQRSTASCDSPKPPLLRTTPFPSDTSFAPLPPKPKPLIPHIVRAESLPPGTTPSQLQNLISIYCSGPVHLVEFQASPSLFARLEVFEREDVDDLLAISGKVGVGQGEEKVRFRFNEPPSNKRAAKRKQARDREKMRNTWEDGLRRDQQRQREEERKKRRFGPYSRPEERRWSKQRKDLDVPPPHLRLNPAHSKSPYHNCVSDSPFSPASLGPAFSPPPPFPNAQPPQNPSVTASPLPPPPFAHSLPPPLPPPTSLLRRRSPIPNNDPQKSRADPVSKARGRFGRYFDVPLREESETDAETIETIEGMKTKGRADDGEGMDIEADFLLPGAASIAGSSRRSTSTLTTTSTESAPQPHRRLSFSSSDVSSLLSTLPLAPEDISALSNLCLRSPPTDGFTRRCIVKYQFGFLPPEIAAHQLEEEAVPAEIRESGEEKVQKYQRWLRMQATGEGLEEEVLGKIVALREVGKKSLNFMEVARRQAALLEL